MLHVAVILGVKARTSRLGWAAGGPASVLSYKTHKLVRGPLAAQSHASELGPDSSSCLAFLIGVHYLNGQNLIGPELL